jgi:hypothetical protein
VFDLTTGAADTAEWLRRKFAGARAAAFVPDTGLAMSATFGKSTKWFAVNRGSAHALHPPANSLPRWHRDWTSLAYFVPLDSTIGIGSGGPTHDVHVDGMVTGLDWTPSGDAAYATVLHDDGLTSLVRVPLDAAPTLVRSALDASPSFNSLAFSPDGRTMYLALASDTTPDVRVRHDPEAPGRELDIYAIDLPNGKPRPVVRAPGDDCCPMVADGYLYWTHNTPGAAVVVMPREGGVPRVVAEHGFLPRWSPDGRQIAFTRGYFRLADYGLDMDNWVVGADSGGSAPAPQVTGYGEDMGAVWSPDGRWIAYHSHRSRNAEPLYDSPGRTDDIWMRRAGDSAEVRVTDFGWEVGPPVWAPDSRRLLFISWDKGGTPRIAKPWIVTIDPQSGRTLSAKRVPLPEGVTSVVDVAWPRSGEQIAFNARVDASHQALWVSRANGSGARKLADVASYTYGGIDWTPDGEEILYGALADGRMQIFAIPSAGGTPRQLTRGDVNLLQPSVSPDGRFVAATRLPWRKELRRTKLSALAGRKPSAN